MPNARPSPLGFWRQSTIFSPNLKHPEGLEGCGISGNRWQSSKIFHSPRNDVERTLVIVSRIFVDRRMSKPKQRIFFFI